MKIIVLIKPTPDTEAKVKISGDGQSIDYSGIKFIINPYDEFAIEESLRLKEKGIVTEVVVASVCNQAHKEVLVKALAMGADRAVLVDHESTYSLETAKIIAKLIKDESPQLVFGGKQAIDDDNMHILSQVGGLLDWPHINVVTKLEVESANKLKVEREVEGGKCEVYSVATPCLLGAHKSLNTPRYTSLPGIMQARKKPFEVKTISQLGVELNSPQNPLPTLSYSTPEQKSAGKVFKGESVEAMVAKVVKLLREEAKVI